MRAPLTLVTGATGFLGRHLCEALFERRAASRGAARPAKGQPAKGRKRAAPRLRLLSSSPSAPSAPTDHPGWAEVEWVSGSVLDPAAIGRAMEGVAQIYHLAGRVSRRPEDARAIYQVHVDGTRSLCEAALAAGVKRIVIASTSGTVAISKSASDPPDETAPSPVGIISRWPYYASKLYQEQVARQICSESDTELVFVNPSLLLGPGDDRLGSTQDVLRFLQRDIPVVPRGGLNLVDVRDVAASLVAAMERGRDGERYLLGGINWSFAELFGRLERLTKVPGPRLSAPDKLALWGAHAIEALYRRLDKAAPVDAASVEMASYFWYLDDSKARRELGHESRDPSETLLDTVRYLRARFLQAERGIWSDPSAAAY